MLFCSCWSLLHDLDEGFFQRTSLGSQSPQAEFSSPQAIDHLIQLLGVGDCQPKADSS